MSTNSIIYKPTAPEYAGYSYGKSQLVPILQSFHEPVGVLESVESVGGGLVKIRIAGLERLVSDELEGELKGLVSKKTSILRAGDSWSAVEVPVCVKV